VNILFVVPYAPNKIRIRPYNLLRFLAARGNRVTLLTLQTDDLDAASIRELVSEGFPVYAYPLPAWRSLVNAVRALPTSDPLQSYYCWQPRLAQKLEELAFTTSGDGSFDVVHIEHLRGVRYGQHLRSRQNARRRSSPKQLPVIWDSVDSISYLFQQAAQQSQKLTSRLLTRFELPRTRVYEARMAQLFDRTLVTSRLDQEAYAALLPPGAAPVTILPNGVDLDYFRPGPDAERESSTLVISGKMSYHANVAMVTYLVEEIMPHIWEKMPEVKLWIVGKDPPKKISDLAARSGITVTGYVPDIRPYLQKATVALAPLTYGAGIQNKVLEAMACGTPVVSTPKAVSALSVRPGEDLFVEAHPAAFAGRVLALLNDPASARLVGACGRGYVEANHSWLAIAGQLEAVYAQAIELEPR